MEDENIILPTYFTELTYPTSTTFFNPKVRIGLRNRLVLFILISSLTRCCFVLLAWTTPKGRKMLPPIWGWRNGATDGCADGKQGKEEKLTVHPLVQHVLD
jgi:hypothetical protein